MPPDDSPHAEERRLSREAAAGGISTGARLEARKPRCRVQPLKISLISAF